MDGVSSAGDDGAGKLPATLIPGDGIGPEITEAVVSVLDALGAPSVWDVQQGGLAGIQANGDPLPGATLDSLRPRERRVMAGAASPEHDADAQSGLASFRVRPRQAARARECTFVGRRQQ